MWSGAATGAAYGAAVELYPAANAKLGATFGTALMALNQDGTLGVSQIKPDNVAKILCQQAQLSAVGV